MFQALYFRNDCIDLHVWNTLESLLLSDLRQVCLAQRRNKHPASESHYDSYVSCYIYMIDLIIAQDCK